MFDQFEKGKIPILMYHSISRPVSLKFQQFTVLPALFAEHMAYLSHHKYTPITVTQLINARLREQHVLPERPVVLTFDDGFADFFTEALPVLRRHSFAATLYVSTAFINGTSRWLQHEGEASRPMLTWDQLAEIKASGIECGAHSHSHPQLDTIPYSLARKEIVQSKQVLEYRLHQEIVSFAYPFGYHTARVRQLVREAGYTSACAVRHNLSAKNDNRFALARLMVSADSHPHAFAALLSGRSPSPLAAAHKMYARARTPTWQLVRRGSALVKHYLRGERLAWW